MWVFGLICLLSITAALPAPESSEIEPPQEPFVNIQKEEGRLEASSEGSSDDKIKEPISEPGHLEIIPEPPELEPLEPVMIEIDSQFGDKTSESSEEKEEKIGEDKEKESGESGEEKKEDADKSSEDQTPVLVNLEVSKPHSFWSNLFSWPPSWFDYLPSFLGGPGRAHVVYPKYYPYYANYRYAYVK